MARLVVLVLAVGAGGPVPQVAGAQEDSGDPPPEWAGPDLDEVRPWSPEDDPEAPPVEEPEPIPLATSEGSKPPDAVDLPGPTEADVTLAEPGEAQEVTDSPIRVAAGSEAAKGEELRVEVLDESAAQRAGVSGFVFRVSGSQGASLAPDQADGRLPVEVMIDYSSFAERYGSNWPDRMRLVALPACALEGAPEPACPGSGVVVPTRVDREAQTLVADVEDLQALRSSAVTSQSRKGMTRLADAVGAEQPVTAADAPQTAQATDAAAGSVVLAVTSGLSGDGGTFAATPLSLSSEWQVGIGSGEFTWSYPFGAPAAPAGATPAAPAGATPEVALSYSSGAVDGMVTTQNTQAPQNGVGWDDFANGFIERRYWSCGNDGWRDANGVQYVDDLCWKKDNATISLNGTSVELVRVPGTNPKAWVLKDDPRWKVQQLHAFIANDDNDGEHWRVTTPDGTEYWFGQTRDSVFYTPVFADDPGEPCGTGGEVCNQGWRWNLNKVVDRNGNVTTYTYTREINHYRVIRGLDGTQPYVRAGRLTRIEYGANGAQGPVAKVELSAEFRCTTLTSQCTNPGPGASGYPDVPTDLICANPCNNLALSSPAFFSAKRYTGVTTFVGTTKVDAWKLNHAHKPNGEGDDKLHLISVQRVDPANVQLGLLPPVAFDYTKLANRLGGTAALSHFRVSSIVNEFGGTTAVTYGRPHPCTPGSQTGRWDTNTKDCFPQFWTPPSGVAGFGEFHKWLTTQVEERDGTGGSPTMTTTYTYGDSSAPAGSLEAGAGWHDDNDELVPQSQQSWSDWRGYGTVLVTQGTSKTHYRLFRGMHGDDLAGTGTGSKSVTIRSLDDPNRSEVDDNQLAGRIFDEAQLKGPSSTANRLTLHQSTNDGVSSIGFPNFSPGPNMTWTSDPSVASHGTHSFRMTKTVAIGEMNAGTTTGGGSPPLNSVQVLAGEQYSAIARFRANSTIRQVGVRIRWLDQYEGAISNTDGTLVNDAVGSWTQASATGTAPAGAVYAKITLRVLAAAVGEWHNVDEIGISNGTNTTWLVGGQPGGPTERGTLHDYISQRMVDLADPIDEPYWVGESETIERRRTPGGTFATKRTTTTYNPSVRLPHAVVEEGWGDQTGDERCTRTDYVGNVTSNPSNPWAEIYILGVPSASTLYAGTGCSGAELRRSETAYDGQAYGAAAPPKGNPTAVRTKTQASPVAWSETKTTYDALGRPKQVTDPNNRVTTTTYTPATGYPTKTEVVNPKSHKTTTDWLVARQAPSKVTDPNGNATNYSYDKLGRVTKVFEPTEPTTGPASWEFIYTIDAGKATPPVVRTRRLQSTNPTVYVDSWVVYDNLARERQSQRLSPQGGYVIVTDTSYDERGLTKEVTLPEAVQGTAGSGILAAPAAGWANRTVTLYDEVERPTSEKFLSKDADGNDVESRVTATSYTHNQTTVNPHVGGDVRTTTDAYDRPITVEEHDGTAWRPTSYGYNLAGDLTSVKDPANHQITYGYDLAGRRTAMNDPDAGAWSYAYDPAGNQTRVTDAKAIQIHTIYDQLNRPTERRRDSTTGQLLAQWNYDAPGELGLLNSSVRLQYPGQEHPGGYAVDVTGYDARSRPTGRSWTLFSADVPGLEGVYPVTYKYDRADHVIEVGYPQVGDPQNGGLPAETVTTTYTGLGLPAGLDGSLLPTSPDEAYAFATIDGYDNRARPVLWGHGPVSADTLLRLRVYDADQRLSQLQANAFGNIVQDRQIDYDPIGNVTERNTFLAAKAWRECFGYDQRNRLTRAYTTAPDQTCATGTPAGGDANFAYNHTYTYSVDGNLTRRVEGPDQTNVFDYTYPTGAHPHAPAAIDGPAASDDWTYTWDANGQQLTRTLGGDTDTLVWGPDRLLEELQEANTNVKNSFVYDADGNRLVRRNVDRTTAYIEGHEIAANNSGSEVKVVRTYSLEGTPVATRTAQHGVAHLITDNQNSVELVIPSGSDTPSQQRTYAPYGQKRTSDEPATDRGWIGQIEDDRTGLNYLNARYYDPTAGRFLTSDPLYDQARPQTINSYGYGLNNPATNSDPRGLWVPIDNGSLPRFGFDARWSNETNEANISAAKAAQEATEQAQDRAEGSEQAQDQAEGSANDMTPLGNAPVNTGTWFSNDDGTCSPGGLGPIRRECELVETTHFLASGVSSAGSASFALDGYGGQDITIEIGDVTGWFGVFEVNDGWDRQYHTSVGVERFTVTIGGVFGQEDHIVSINHQLINPIPRTPPYSYGTFGYKVYAIESEWVACDYSTRC